jgi:hypothetical protein
MDFSAASEESLLKLGFSTSAASHCRSSTNPCLQAMPSRPPYEHEVVKKWTAQIAASNGFVFITPEYNYGPAAVCIPGSVHLAPERDIGPP